MKRLNRENCAVLHLGLKGHWYRMIESGAKCIEFREATPYWRTRICNWVRRVNAGKTPVLEFQNGYGRFSPRMTFVAGRGTGVVFEFRLADIPIQHKELGEFQKDRYVLLIGERVELTNGGNQ